MTMEYRILKTNVNNIERFHPQYRGLFIGWNESIVECMKTMDTWKPVAVKVKDYTPCYIALSLVEAKKAIGTHKETIVKEGQCVEVIEVDIDD